MSRVIAFIATLLFAVLAPQIAAAGPAGGSVGGSASTSRGTSGRSSGSGFEFPERVIGGNAISILGPFQIGAVSYLPKARFAFQYDRQLIKAHWIYVGLGIIGDHGRWKNFRMDDCGLENAAGMNPDGACGRGSVLGVDVYAGYAHKWYIKKKPYIVPIVRASIGYSWWKYPPLRGGEADREQSRIKSWGLTLRPGGGVRIFLLEDLSIGVDVNIPLGFLVHTDVPLDGTRDRKGSFLLGFEILPVVVEYRF